MTLFQQNEQKNAPLADRMRPQSLDEFYGQRHIVGPGKLLRRAIEADRLTSCIFYGPPGCGKTTLAGIIAAQTNAAFIKMNAVTSGVSDVREELKKAADRRAMFGQPTYLLLDECHRWSKAQSDSILPAMESGLIRFIGSTTENPMIAMTPDVQEATDKLRSFLFENVYLNPKAKAEETKAKEVVYALFTHYVVNPDRLPERYRRRIGTAEGETVERAVADFISGMTDRYAIETYQERFVPRVWRGLHE